MQTYRITRHYANPEHDSVVLETGLTLDEAQEHCRDPETSSNTCTEANNIAHTEKMGAWFDGYEEE